MNDRLGQTLPQGVDARLFRRVMGSFATGVTVITVRDGEGMRGMTANAFMSGSLEPPLCIVSVAKRAHLHAILMEATHFGVSILSEHQERMSDHFSGRPDSRLDIKLLSGGPVPLLAESCARVAAEIVARHDCGDHTIFIGHILHMETEDRPPLLYHAGRYATLNQRKLDHDVPVPEFW